MKKTVYAVLIVCLVLGLPLMILDGLTIAEDGIRIPPRFEEVIVDLSDGPKTDALLFTHELEAPATVEFFMQSDAAGNKNVKVVSESEVLGTDNREFDFNVGFYTGTASTSATYIMAAGKYSVYLTSEQTDGRIAIGYQETEIEASEYSRLYQIHRGDLDNPPAGYERVYASDLSGQSSENETVYTLLLDTSQTIGISVYTSSAHGTVSVDLIGESTSYYGLVHPVHNRICDQLETTLPAGEYRFELTCQNADGQCIIFIKK